MYNPVPESYKNKQMLNLAQLRSNRQYSKRLKMFLCIVLLHLNLGPWLKETFEPSLIMSVLLVSLGGATAWYAGMLSMPLLLVAMLAAVLIQNAVNVLNDYYDFVKGIDKMTEKTPFSGGSKYIVQGLISARGAYLYGIGSLFAAGIIGMYFSLTRNILLLPIVLEALLSTYFYSTVLSRYYLGEFFAGLNLGPLAVLGAYIVASGSISLFPIMVGITPGLMIANVLLMNEIPDMEADRLASRRNIVILLGKKHVAWLVLLVGALAYGWISFLLMIHLLPFASLLTFLSLPAFVAGASIGVKNFSSTKKMVPALGLNIVSAFLTILLLAVSLLIGK